MRPREAIDEFVNRRFQLIEENDSISKARNLLNSFQTLIVTKEGQPTYVLDINKIAGEAGNKLIKTIIADLDKAECIQSGTYLDSIKDQLRQKTLLVCDNKNQLMGTINIQDVYAKKR